MKIVIDIPEVFYEALKKTDEIVSGQRSGKTFMSVIYNAVANGTPLPKGHGRLIDADTLEECKEVMNTIMNECEYAVRMDEVRNVSTIIEADKAESEEVRRTKK